MSTSLAIPTVRELEALAPTDRWDLEDALDTAQGALRAFNDDELRRWVEVEGKTQAEIAELVGRDRSRVSRRCLALGIAPASKRGRPRIVRAHKSSAPAAGESDDGEVVDGEVVGDDAEEEAVDPATYELHEVYARSALTAADLPRAARQGAAGCG